MQHRNVTPTRLVARYGTQQAAADALGCDRITLWRWQRDGDRIPEPWVWKAAWLLTQKGKAK